MLDMIRKLTNKHEINKTSRFITETDSQDVYCWKSNEKEIRFARSQYRGGEAVFDELITDVRKHHNTVRAGHIMLIQLTDSNARFDELISSSLFPNLKQVFSMDISEWPSFTTPNDVKKFTEIISEFTRFALELNKDSTSRE